MNRKQLLAALTAAGYTGKADLADIKQYLANEGRDSDSITINDETYKIDDVFAKAAPLSAKVDAEADEPVIVKPTKKASTGYANTVGKVESKGVIGAPAVRSDRERAVKAYTARARNQSADTPIEKRAIWEDGETAEAFTAFFRLASTNPGTSYSEKANDLDIIGKANVEFDNTLGGATVPQQFSNQLIWLTEQYGVALKVASVERMTSDVGNFPRQTVIQPMTPSAEGAVKSTADDIFDSVTLTCREASLIKQASYQWYEDSAVNVGDTFARNFAESAARRIDLDYFLGDGTSAYNNFIGLKTKLGTSGNKYVAGTGGAWSAWTTNDFNKALGRLEFVNSSRLRMIGSRQNFYAAPNRLQTAVSQFVQLVGPGVEGADKSFLSLPYHFAQVLWEGQTAPETTGATPGVFIGDFAGGSKIGLRDELKIMYSEHYGFANGLLAWRGTMRYAINIHLDGRGATYGPILALGN
jgi:HK97 family phage major capsid protein